MEYLPTFTIKINVNGGKYTIPHGSYGFFLQKSKEPQIHCMLYSELLSLVSRHLDT